MLKIPERGKCPLELCLLLLFMAVRLKQIVRDKGEKAKVVGNLDISTPTFGRQMNVGLGSNRAKSHSTTGRRGRSVRKTLPTGFPDAPAENIASREMENLVQYESMSEMDSDDDTPRPETLRVNHINYFNYFENGELN